MRLHLAIFLLWIFSHKSTSLIRFDVPESWLHQKIVSKRKSNSNFFDATCRLFSDVVRKYPINPPYIKRVSFQLRTSCRHVSYAIDEMEHLLRASEFNANGKTVIFIAGWLTTPDEHYIEEMANAYRCRGGNNFLIFDNGGFLFNEYMNAAYHTQRLGEYIAFGLQRLRIPPSNIHLVGHSLGAHIAGSAGRNFYMLTGQKLGRITALDPARPCFRTPAIFPRLSHTDAAFVDVIHTNPYDVGTEEQIGHVDFFPGGLDVIKPGCFNKILMCSHELSIQYYIESVYTGNEWDFMGKKCNSPRDLERKFCGGRSAPMGYAADPNSRGLHYLPVRAQWPYGVNARKNATLKSSICGKCFS